MVQSDDSLPRRNSDPVWLQDFYLHTGHDAETRSGSATFVRRRGDIYVCTCRHIVESLKDPRIVPGAMFPSLALSINRTHINLSHMTASGPRTNMRSPKDDAKTDIAIYRLPPHIWDFMAANKAKVPIDLDNWREPDWSKVRFGVACGYPDEHKKNLSGPADQVANQLISVVAEIASVPEVGQRTITLSSILDQPHSWYFSGLSGGPMYAVEGGIGREVPDEELFPIGIVFEGFPSSGRFSLGAERDLALAFLTDKDLFIRALAITPHIFDEWLVSCEYL